MVQNLTKNREITQYEKYKLFQKQISVLRMRFGILTFPRNYEIVSTSEAA